MANRWLVPGTVPLPSDPALAVCLSPCADLGPDSVPGLAPGEVVNVLTGTPDDGDGRALVFAVACGVAGAREGWLRCDAIRLLSEEEAREVSQVYRLPPRETVRRCTFVRAYDDWQPLEEHPNCIALREHDIVQVATVRARWAYGWPLSAPTRRGWFPLARVRKLESSVSAIAVAAIVDREPLELPQGAADALHAHIQEARQAGAPPAIPPAWEGELPALVAESAQKAEREWREHLSHADARAAMAAEAEAAGVEVGGQAEQAPTEESTVIPADLPDEYYPLVVCKVHFQSPRGVPQGTLLELKVGDLVRVTSGLEGSMYYGFVETRSHYRGWFPKRNVQLLEDPLGDEANSLPVQIGLPALPKVPDFLQRRVAAA